jgi:tetratricopeptide (TPR) repeat protein
MGKTNLLIHAKRELENELTVIVYVDCTTLSAGDARSCFRSIIDLSIETNPLLFRNVASEILESRKQQNLSAHKEHESEIRSLFREYGGKIIFILDEIDALTNSAFSDQIFAQIRSIYFTRVNYPEFERLTYILSGVLEPADIIKDKNRSPFNIGEKIYLGDFSFEEHEDFVSKLGLDVSREVKDRIYYWANGNPRMTWDVCSALEDVLLGAETIDESAVDTLIDRLYLRDFDRAPVDHIRNIVQADKELRQALKLIHTRKADQVSKKMARKLYLAGIIESDLQSNACRIKNKVIEYSLTVEWLGEIDDRTKNLNVLAAEEIQRGNYQKALEYYLEFYSNADIQDTKMLSLILRGIANCYYNLRQFTESIRWYEMALEKTDIAGAPDAYYELMYTIGLNNLILGQYQNSVNRFKEIVDKYALRGDIYFKSFLNLATSYYKLDYYKHKVSALKDYLTIVEEIDSHKFANENLKGQIKQIALINIGLIEKRNGEKGAAIQHLTQALSAETGKHRPRILIELFELTESPETRKKQLESAVDSVISDNLHFALDLEDPFLFDRELMLKIIAYAYIIKDEQLVEKIFSYSAKDIFRNEANRLEFLYDVALYEAYQLKEFSASEAIFRQIFAALGEQEVDLLLRSYRSMGMVQYLGGNTDYHSALDKYLVLLKKRQNFNRPISRDDFNAAIYYIIYLREHRQITRALEICKLFESFENPAVETGQLEFVLIYFLHAQLSDILNDRDASLSYAKRTLSLIDSNRLSKDMPIDHQGISTIQRELNKIVKDNISIQLVEDPFWKIGRNQVVMVRYVDGTVKQDKFKRLESDLRMKICTLVDG